MTALDWRTLPREHKERLRDRLRGELQAQHQPFYCARPGCDGRPHDRFGWNHARADQHPPDGEWLTWLLLGGRGSGKTRSGAEWVHEYKAKPGSRGALIGPTSADVRDTIVEGESGLIATARPENPCRYVPSKRRMEWANGAQAIMYSGDEPDRLRGPQHHWAWVDESAAMRNIADLWAMLLLGLRLGEHPQVVTSTTPRPLRWLRALMKDPTTTITRASTYDNLHNLAPTFQEQVVKQYEGTRLGRQELYAEILDDVEGALWHLDAIHEQRVAESPHLNRVVVAIDPAATSTEESDETGIVVAGRAGDHYYTLADRSGRYSPQGWAERAVAAYREFNADEIVAEVNNGGDMVVAVLRQVDAQVPVRKVHATRGKRVRAEPVALLHEQGRDHHVGVLPALEEQLTTWTPEGSDFSPDRLDAKVWAMTRLMGRDHKPARLVST